MADLLPKKYAIDYYKDMLRQIRLMERLTIKAYNERIAPLVIKLQHEMVEESRNELKTNAMLFESLSARLQQIHEATITQVSGEFSSISLEVQALFNKEIASGIARKFVNRIDKADRVSTTRSIANVIPKKSLNRLKGLEILRDENVQSIARSTIKRNIDLIRSIPVQYIEGVKESVYKGLEDGRSAKAIGKEITAIGGVAERRGQFIARDQLGSVYGDLTKKRQENLGLKRFKWIASNDERVRESHEKIDGMVFDWDKGAAGPGVPLEVQGLVPGEDYNCRCTSTIVQEDVESLLERLAGGVA